MSQKAITDRALGIIRRAPRITLNCLDHNPGARTKPHQVTKVHNRGGKSQKELQVGAKPPLGWIFGDWYKPWQRRFPGDAYYNADIYVRREYPPLSLLELQRLIDLGWIDVNRPVDLATICNTKLYNCDPQQRQFGVQLTDEGVDIFSARLNIEVQWASDLAISAIERNGGVVTCAYFDPISLDALVDPLKFFMRGEPIPKRAFPPRDAMEMYLNPARRGYLADPAAIQNSRVETAQKYGYPLPDVGGSSLLPTPEPGSSPPSTTEQPSSDLVDLMSTRKDPLQVFYGLEPGSIVNLADKTVLKPTDPDLVAYYQRATMPEYANEVADTDAGHRTIREEEMERIASDATRIGYGRHQIIGKDT